jgi:hypothetical protein
VGTRLWRRETAGNREVRFETIARGRLRVGGDGETARDMGNQIQVSRQKDGRAKVDPDSSP